MCVFQQHERGLGFPGEHDNNPSKYVETDPYIEVFRSSNPPKKNKTPRNATSNMGHISAWIGLPFLPKAKTIILVQDGAPQLQVSL